MQDIDDKDLVTVTGGASAVSKNNSELELALTNLQSDLKDLAKPQQNQTLFTAMAFGMLARRLA